MHATLMVIEQLPQHIWEL